MITYAIGDATAPSVRPVIVAHVVNDTGRFGAGFSGAVARRWPRARTDYLDWHRDGFTLGDIMLAGAGDRLWVAHLAAQHGVGRRDRPLRLDALEQCLVRLADAAVELRAAVACPRLGTGLAGGSWADVEPLLAGLARRVPVTVYDLPGGTR